MSSTQQSRNQELVAQYEQLRGDALSLSGGGKPTSGLALFLRQGMTAWMRAWLSFVPKREADAVPSVPSQPDPPYPLEVRTQIAILLAGIILSPLEVAP